MQRKRWVAELAVLAALVGGLSSEAAAKPKQTMSAIVNGHKVKLKNKQIQGAIAGAGGISITGGTKLRHLGQVVKSLVVTCASGPLTGGTLAAPAPGQTCTIGYMETKVSRHPTVKEWQAPYGGPTVTFTEFDGTRVQGTFSGTLDPVTGTTGSVTVTTGMFSVLVP